MQTKLDKKRAENPRDKASWFSKITFGYLNKLISKGYRRNLEANDLFEVLDEESTSTLGKRLQREWEKELERASPKHSPKLSSALLRTFKGEIFKTVALTLMTEILRVLPSVLFAYYLAIFSNAKTKSSQRNGYLYAAGIALSLILGANTFQYLMYYGENLGLSIHTAVTSLIYCKALRLNQAAFSQTSSGYIINMISTDAQKLLSAAKFVGFLFVAPLELVAYTVLLWFMIGPTCFIASAFLIVLIFVQLGFGRRFGTLRKKVVQYTDERVKLMSEIISGMRVLKMYAWEEPFVKLINKMRRDELKQIKRATGLRALNAALPLHIVDIIVLVTFAVFVISGKTLTVAAVLSTVALTNACNILFSLYLPRGIQDLLGGRASSKTIQHFLTMNEMVSPNYERVTDHEPQRVSTYSEDDTFIRLTTVTARWNDSTDQPTLSSISLSVDRDNPMMIVAGPMGAGKSSLLMAILGDLPVTSGHIKVQGSIGYVAQQPWIFSGTVRQNVTFGLPYNKIKYEAVVLACDLTLDIQALPDQDNTLVGERGIALDEGQKVKISLARAVYQDCDLYLLDDPLSAVDSKVSRYLFEKCICGILKYKPKILVTQQYQYLDAGTEVLYLNEGKAVAQGDFYKVKDAGFDEDSLLFQDETQEKEWDHDSAIDAEEIRLRHRHKPRFGREGRKVGSTDEQSSFRSREKKNLLGSSLGSCNAGFVDDGEEYYLKEYKSRETEDWEEEERNSGRVAYKFYLEYFQNGTNVILLPLVILLMVLPQVGTLFADLWLAKWAEGDEREANRKVNETISIALFIENDRLANLKILAALSLGSLLLGLIRAFSFYHLLLNASRNLHKKMLNAVLKAPIYFFDTNPTGRVLNRFSKDVFFMDEELIWAMFEYSKYVLLTLTVVLLNVISFPYILIAFLPLLVIFLFLRKYFLTSARELKRLEEISRRPVLSHFSDTLEGLVTIRALGKKTEMEMDFNRCQDFHSTGWFLLMAADRWFAFRLDFILAMLVSISVFAPVIIREFTEVNCVMTGLSVLYILNLANIFQLCFRQGAAMENMMTSVKRVTEYSKLDPEPDFATDVELPSVWPKYGVITGEGVSFSYHHSQPFVLKNLFFCIKAKEKVGVIGRMGAGKSSLIGMLLQMAKTTGTIRIDGIATSRLSLKDLRGRMAVIPQNPVLFSGPLRKNIDPFGEFHDADIWDALEEVQLKDAVMELPQRLSTDISQGNLNVSVGQRQLLCLARAILKKTKILLIEEATASLESDTDSLIQETIREKFKDCTVLVIAHRLSTIMDSDRVLVMHEGRIVEFEEPYELLKRPESLFRHFVEQTGHAEASRLRMMAEVACKLRRMIAEQERARSPLQDGWKKSRSRHEILQMFGTRVVYESTV